MGFWQPGKPPAYAGTDFIVARNGRIAPERIAYAIYSRSYATFSVSSMGSFTDPVNEHLLKSVLRTYKFAFI
jgi:hypothetical protein